jgi:hypothetical protein
MNLNSVTARCHPTSAAAIAEWRDGYAWLAGGTWLFSEPQPATDTLIDLDHLGWPALEASPGGLEIGATCRIAELYRFEAPRAWIAAPLIRGCCEAPARFLQSLECGHGRRQYMHVVAGRGDDFTGRCPRGTLHALAA